MIGSAPVHDRPMVVADLVRRFGEQHLLAVQPTKDDIPTIWIEKDRLRETLQYLKLGHRSAVPDVVRPECDR